MPVNLTASDVSHHMHHLLPPRIQFLFIFPCLHPSNPFTPLLTWLELRDLSLVVSAHSDHTVCGGTKGETHTGIRVALRSSVGLVEVHRQMFFFCENTTDSLTVCSNLLFNVTNAVPEGDFAAPLFHLTVL